MRRAAFRFDRTARLVGTLLMVAAPAALRARTVRADETYGLRNHTGRLDRDTLNLMTQGEGVIAAGGGHQTGWNRWVDYHSMSVDPVDDCTFWFSGEYYAATSSAGWATRIAAFRLLLCGDLIFRSGFNFGS